VRATISLVMFVGINAGISFRGRRRRRLETTGGRQAAATVKRRKMTFPQISAWTMRRNACLLLFLYGNIFTRRKAEMVCAPVMLPRGSLCLLFSGMLRLLAICLRGIWQAVPTLTRPG